MTCIPLQKTWQMSLLWLMDPLVPEQRWLAYHYTQLGRWTYFGWTQWQRFESSSTHHFWDTPQHFLKTHFCLESGFLSFLSTRAEMTCIPLHKTWQMNLLWLMDPLVSEQRCLAYHYTNLADEPTLAEHNWQRFESSSTHHFWDTKQHFLKTHFCLESGFLSCLELQKSLLVSFQGCWTQWQRFESSSTHHFWDTCQHFLKTHFCLESGFLSFLIPEQRWLAYHYTNLADETTLAEHNSKGLKALALTISEITHSIFSKHIFA